MERLTIPDVNIGFIDSSRLPSYTALYERLRKYEGLEEQGKLLKLPCAVGDIVFDIALGDDKKFHIVEMEVCSISLYGDLRKGMVWNVYLEDDYSKAYRSFHDFGKTVFLIQTEAEEALRKMWEEK